MMTTGLGCLGSLGSGEGQIPLPLKDFLGSDLKTRVHILEPRDGPGPTPVWAELIRGRELISPIHTIHRSLGSLKTKLFVINGKKLKSRVTEKVDGSVSRDSKEQNIFQTGSFHKPRWIFPSRQLLEMPLPALDLCPFAIPEVVCIQAALRFDYEVDPLGAVLIDQDRPVWVVRSQRSW
jgi:hypothetical protein